MSKTLNIGEPEQCATNAFDVTIDDLRYRVAHVGFSTFFVWTWTGVEWVDVEVQPDHVDALKLLVTPCERGN